MLQDFPEANLTAPKIPRRYKKIINDLSTEKDRLLNNLFTGKTKTLPSEKPLFHTINSPYYYY